MRNRRGRRAKETNRRQPIAPTRFHVQRIRGQGRELSDKCKSIVRSDFSSRCIPCPTRSARKLPQFLRSPEPKHRSAGLWHGAFYDRCGNTPCRRAGAPVYRERDWVRGRQASRSSFRVPIIDHLLATAFFPLRAKTFRNNILHLLQKTRTARTCFNAKIPNAKAQRSDIDGYTTVTAKTLNFLFRCHRSAPFLFFNGNTFAEIVGTDLSWGNSTGLSVHQVGVNADHSGLGENRNKEIVTSPFLREPELRSSPY